MKNIVGKILRELLNKQGAPTRKDFSGMMNISEKTLYNVLDGSSSFTLEQVHKASILLNYNIIAEYYNSIGEDISILSEPKEEYNTSNAITMTFNFSVPTIDVNNIGVFIKELNELAKLHRIRIL
jgi:predicted transcriptional regulator